MKKLTAGIFAGILTIVTVNAADAAITSKAYVDGKIGAVETKVTTNTGDITQLKTDVAGNKTSISDLQQAVENLSGDGTGSVADQIAGALGEIPEGSTVSAELGKKQDKSTALSFGDANGAWKPVTADQQAAIDSGIKAADVTQITTNKNDISGIKTNIGNLPEGKTVVQMITDATDAAAGNVDDKLGDLGEGNTTVADALADKQNLLNNTNVKEAGTGNAIVSITAENGVVTATKGAVIPEVTTKGETGTFVLTATVTDDGVTGYMWEQIERGTPAE